ncbi:MAG: DUF6440 family protein [Lentilactobacillus diolivorans]|jgi:hypothetical protein|nr:DUF6440 family protein [Lentilactobacillus diolivorans]RRG01216.1 MAG: hypothetical protein DUD34_12875 [Lactobacillus sp.]
MSKKEKDVNADRFNTAINEIIDTGQNVDVLVDHKTKVQYLIVSQSGIGGGVGVTVLVDKDGKPLLAE